MQSDHVLSVGSTETLITAHKARRVSSQKQRQTAVSQSAHVTKCLLLHYTTTDLTGIVLHGYKFEYLKKAHITHDL